MLINTNGKTEVKHIARAEAKKIIDVHRNECRIIQHSRNNFLEVLIEKVKWIESEEHYGKILSNDGIVTHFKTIGEPF
jgi:hypothetical protein